jgi:hypothetical protein
MFSPLHLVKSSVTMQGILLSLQQAWYVLD